MMLCETETMTRMPAVSMMDVPNRLQKHLTWWPDWEFTNDLLLKSQRPVVADITVTAEEALFTAETMIEISFQINNQTQKNHANLHVSAVVQDDFGMLMTHSRSRLTQPVGTLTPGGTHNATFRWQSHCASQCYHLLLIVEDEHGNMVDVVAGQFTLA